MKKTSLSRWRVVAATLAAWLPAVVLLATRAIWWPRLPDRLPTHWSGLGLPDGFSATITMWTWVFALALLAGIVAVVAAALDSREPAPARTLLGFAGGVGGLSTAIWLMSTTATLAAGSAQDARLGSRLLWIVAGIVWIVVPYVIAGRPHYEPIVAEGRPEGLGLSPGERAAWVAVLHSRLILTASAVAFVATVVVAVTVDLSAWIAAGLILVALMLFGQVRVTVDRRGVRLIAGLLSLRLKRIPLTDIESASPEHINPARWGGWGYRVRPGGSALILRSGPGLVLKLTNGRFFAVTIDDPETPAALLASLRGNVRY